MFSTCHDGEHLTIKTTQQVRTLDLNGKIMSLHRAGDLRGSSPGVCSTLSDMYTHAFVHRCAFMPPHMHNRMHKHTHTLMRTHTCTSTQLRTWKRLHLWGGWLKGTHAHGMHTDACIKACIAVHIVARIAYIHTSTHDSLHMWALAR